MPAKIYYDRDREYYLNIGRDYYNNNLLKKWSNKYNSSEEELVLLCTLLTCFICLSTLCVLLIDFTFLGISLNIFKCVFLVILFTLLFSMCTLLINLLSVFLILSLFFILLICVFKKLIRLVGALVTF